MGRIEDLLASCDPEFDDPALQHTEGDQYKRDKRSRLHTVHWKMAGRGELSTFYGGQQIGSCEWDHIEEKDQLEGVIHHLEERFASAWKNGDKLFDLDGEAFFTAVADA